MNPIPIAPSQSTAARPSDSSSSPSSETDAGFGPILQAAASKAAPGPDSSRSTPSTTRGSGGGSKGKGDGRTQGAPGASPAGAPAPEAAHGAAGQATDPGTAATVAGAIAAQAAQARAEASPPADASSAIAGTPATSPWTAADGGAEPGAADPASAGATAARVPSQGQPTTELDAAIAAPGLSSPTSLPSAAGAAGHAAMDRLAGSTPDGMTPDPGAGQDVATLTAAGAAATLQAAGRDAVQSLAQTLAGAATQVGSKAADASAVRADSPSAALSADSSTSAQPGVATPPAGVAFSAPTSYAPEVRASVAAPVTHPGFGEELSDRVVMLTRSGVQAAQLSLEPAGMGPVGVSIQLHGHAATLAFSAANETTRNALEAALPRLREMFASCGMQLSDATVGGRAQPDWTAPQRSRPSGRDSAPGGPLPDSQGISPSDAPAAGQTAAVRLVDIYA